MQEEQVNVVIMNRPGESGIACAINGVDSNQCDVNPALEFLTEFFPQGLKYKTICSYRSEISDYNDTFGRSLVDKHLHVSK